MKYEYEYKYIGVNSLQSYHGDTTHNLGTEGNTGTQTSAITDLGGEGVEDHQDNSSGDTDDHNIGHLQLLVAHGVSGGTHGNTFNQVFHNHHHNFHSVHFVFRSILLISIFFLLKIRFYIYKLLFLYIPIC